MVCRIVFHFFCFHVPFHKQSGAIQTGTEYGALLYPGRLNRFRS